MSVWFATLLLSCLGMGSSNNRIVGWCVWVGGFSLFQLAHGAGLL